ncbi:hypothetical protein EV715DRAFT_297214 [Schizophyllum commune]
MTIDLTFDLPAIPAGSTLQSRPSGRAQQTRGTNKDVTSRDSRASLPFNSTLINRFDEAAMIAGGSGIPPMHKILEYALKNKENKTGFTPIFVNVTGKDILLKEQFDDEGWKGPTGYVNAELIEQPLAPATLDEKVKLIVGRPPDQVAALAGKKAGDAQGELLGVSKGLSYTPKQVFKF